LKRRVKNTTKHGPVKTLKKLKEKEVGRTNTRTKSAGMWGTIPVCGGSGEVAESKKRTGQETGEDTKKEPLVNWVVWGTQETKEVG